MCLPHNVDASTIQAIATTVGNLLSFNFGLMFGVTPASLRLYLSPGTPLNRSVGEDDATWTAAILFLGAAIGRLAAGLLCNRIGPKSVLLCCGLLQMCGWFCVHFANDILHIHFSRLSAGLAAGGAFAALPVYVDEIAQEPQRMGLVASVEVWRSVGVAFGIVLSELAVPYITVNIVGIGVAVAFNLLFPFVQESPHYYRRQGDAARMEKSLRWFRGIRDISDRNNVAFVRELDEFKAKLVNRGRKQAANKTTPQTPCIETRLPKRYLPRVLAISLVLSLCGHLCGNWVLLSYADDVLREIQWKNGRAIIIWPAAMQVLGASASLWLIPKVNRKVILRIAAIICGISLTCLVLLIKYGARAQLYPMQAPWLSITLLASHMLVSNVGFYALTSLMTSEILSPQVKAAPSRERSRANNVSVPFQTKTTITSTTDCAAWLCTFFLIKFYIVLHGTIGLLGLVSLCASFCFFVAVFGAVVPESRNRTNDEVQSKLGYIVDGDVATAVSSTNGYFRHGVF